MSTSSKSKTIGKAATPPVQRSAAQPAKDASSVKPATAVPVVQRKLTVGSANDVYEQQADAMAEKVVNMTEADVAVKRREGVKNKSPLAVQAKAIPVTSLLRKSAPLILAKSDEKLQKKAGPVLKKKAEEKVQKSDELKDPKLPDLQKTKQDNQASCCCEEGKKEASTEKIQKRSEEKKLEINAEKQKIAQETGHKITKSELRKKAGNEQVQRAADAELKKKEEQKQQSEAVRKKAAAEKDGEKNIQRKNAQEQQRQVSNAQVTQQINEPKQRSHELTEKDLRRKPEQKEEEKIKKKDEPLKKKAEEKPQKKSEEKVQQKAAVKVQKQAVVQLVRTITAAPPAPRRTAKEEDKLKKKAEEKPQKKTEEKVQKTTEKATGKDGVNPVSPAPAAKPLVARTILPKEDDKMKKKADEKLQKAAEEKVQKSSEKVTAKDGIHPVSPVAAPIRPKEDEKLKKKPDVQRDAAEAATETSVSPAFEAKLGTEMNGGRAMDAGTKAYMEIRFGVDFSQVRIHTDGTSARLCNEIGAQAFAYKNHIFFNSGKYRPDSQSGRFLLAHELTHVIQQGYALHKSADKEKPAISKTEEKKPQRSVTHSGPRIQRLGWDTVNNAVRRAVPVWTLLTVIMGYNPILGESVGRSATTWFNALLDLIPVVGPSIFDKLMSSGIMGRVQQWFDSVFAELPTYNEISSTWDRCWEAMGIRHGIDGNIEIFRNHFGPLITRIVNFGTKVFNKVVEFLRETLLRPLDNVVKDIPGWELITVLIGTNPLTGERKERTAMNVLRGVVAFIPGGQEKLDQLVQSRALEKAYQWFITETTARNLTWERIRNTFQTAFDSLQARDILSPIETFRRLAGIFSPLMRDLVGFAGAALEKLLEFIFETVMGAGGALVLSTLRKVRSTFLLVIRDPVGFLRNLVRGVGQGVQQFGRNILTHLRDGVIAWLTGPIAAAGVQMPEKWDMKGFIWFGLQIMGLTWDKIKPRMIAKLGERVVTALETGFEFIMEVREKGIVKALKERISTFFGGLRDQLLNKIKSFITEKIVTAGIQQLLALLSPVGAVIDAIIKTYNTIMFFIDNIRRILEFVNSVLDSITAIATGNLAQAANFIERTMARTIPILLDFLARFLNLGNVAKKVQDAIKALQDWVGSKVDAVIDWVKKTVSDLYKSGKDLANKLVEWWKSRKKFRSRDGGEHNIFFNGTGKGSKLMLASEEHPMEDYFSDSHPVSLVKKYKDDSAKTGIVNAAKAKYLAIKELSKNEIPTNKVKELNKMLNELADLLGQLEISGSEGNKKLPDIPSPIEFGQLEGIVKGLPRTFYAAGPGSFAEKNRAAGNLWYRIKDDNRVEHNGNMGATASALSGSGVINKIKTSTKTTFDDRNKTINKEIKTDKDKLLLKDISGYAITVSDTDTQAEKELKKHTETAFINFAKHVKAQNPVINKVDIKIYTLKAPCPDHSSSDKQSTTVTCQASGAGYTDGNVTFFSRNIQNQRVAITDSSISAELAKSLRAKMTTHVRNTIKNQIKDWNQKTAPLPNGATAQITEATFNPVAMRAYLGTLPEEHKDIRSKLFWIITQIEKAKAIGANPEDTRVSHSPLNDQSSIIAWVWGEQQGVKVSGKVQLKNGHWETISNEATSGNQPVPTETFMQVLNFTIPQSTASNTTQPAGNTTTKEGEAIKSDVQA